MSFFSTASQVIGDFSTKLAGSAYAATPVAYPNIPFEEPAETPWMRVNVIPGPSRQVTIGGTQNRWVQDGGVTVQIKVPEGTGTGDAYQIADTVAGFFRRQETENVLYRRIIVVEVGSVDGWYQVNVVTTFEDSYLF